MLRTYRQLAGLALVKCPADRLEQVCTEYRDDSNVLYAEPDYVISVSGTPDDPHFGQQWGLRNTGQTVSGDTGTIGADIRAPEAWRIWSGDPDFRIAVIDTGVDYTHPDLAANVWTNPGEIPGNGADDDRNGWVDDVHGFNFLAGSDGADPMDDNVGVWELGGSNYGPIGVDLGAPGVNIFSTLPVDMGHYGYLSGTSMAAPHVTGVVALVMSRNPRWPWRRVRDRVLATVRPVSSLAFCTATGGLVNAAAAVGDCNINGIVDKLDIHDRTSFDCNHNDIPDECESDCNVNGLADACDVRTQRSDDCNGNGVPDECEDCDQNGVGDACEIVENPEWDLDADGVLDRCRRVLEVPAQFDEIQSALDAARDGDVVLVAAGDYVGAGNIDVDPQFVDPTGPDGYAQTGDGDLRLEGDSECVNAGDPAYIPSAEITDASGSPRRQGCIVDIGCFEATVPGVFGDFNGNGHRELADVMGLQLCFGAEVRRPRWLDACACLFDHDGDESVGLAAR